MKNFEFRLDSALRWRNTQLQLERVKLQSLLGEQQRVSRDLQTLAEERKGAISGLQSLPELQSFDLRSVSAYLVGAELRATQLNEQLAKRKALADKQRERVMDAEVQVRLLEKLREKRKTAWQVEFDKDLESNAAEAWLAANFGR